MLGISKGTGPRKGSGRFAKFIAAGIGVVVLGTGLGTTGAAAGPGAAETRPTAARAEQPATQAVGITYLGGPGHPGPVWAGTWNNPERGFCIDFARHSPTNAGTTRITGAIPGMSAKQSTQIKHIANAYSRTTSPKEAAAAQFAIWRIEGDPAFATWYDDADVKPADRRAVAAILDEVKHEPYRITLSAEKLQVGQLGSGKVKFLGDDPAEVAGLPVALAATGAKIRTVNGVAGTRGALMTSGLNFTYERSGAGRVDLKAVMSAPSAAVGGLSITRSGNQRTLSGGYVDPAQASYGYQLTPGQPTVTSKCDTDCDGVATLTFNACNAAGSDAVKWTHKVGTDVVATLTAAGGKCATKTAKVADGKKIAASYCYTSVTPGGACATETLATGKAYEVVCPPWAKAVYSMSCNCDADGGGTVTFTAPAGSARFYRGFVAVTADGKKTNRQVDLAEGPPVGITLTSMPKGGEVVVSFKAFRDAKRTAAIGGEHVLVRVTVAPAE